MDKERYQPKTRLPLDPTLAKTLREELVEAGRTGNFEQAHHAVHDLDLMGEATKLDVLYGLHRLGQSKSWVQDLHDAIAAAKAANHPERVQELVRMANLMEQTEDRFGLRTIMRWFDRRIPSAERYYQQLWDEAEQEKEAQIAVERAARVAAAAEAQRQAREEAENRRRAAADAEARRRAEEVERQRAAREEASRRTREAAEQERRARAEQQRRAEEQASQPFKTESDAEKRKKSKIWLDAQDHFTSRWTTIKREQLLPTDNSEAGIFTRFRAAMDLIHEYILEDSYNSNPATTRAGLEALIPLIWTNAEEVRSFMSGASKSSGSIINPFAKVIFLPKNLRPSQPLYRKHLNSEQKIASRKLIRRLSYALFPNCKNHDADAKPRYPESFNEFDEAVAILRTQFNAAYESFKEHRR